MMLLLQIAGGVLSILSLVCVALTFAPSIYAGITDNALSHRPKAASIAFVVLALIGWSMIFYHGVYSLLWFLPDSFGSWQEDEWKSARQMLSISLAGWGVFGLTHYAKQIAWKYLDDEEERRKKEDESRKRQDKH